MNALLPIYSAEQLFVYCKLDIQLAELRALAGFDTPVFDLIIRNPLLEFAELVQLAPASESHHHSGPGGLLTHTIDVITRALKKRRGYQLPIAGSLIEISAQRHLWTYAVFVGCLLHDIGKLSANTRLILIALDGTEQCWTPHSGAMTKIYNLKGYRIEFEKTPYQYHSHLALTHWHLVPAKARTWLIEASNIMAELTAWLWGDKFESGTIGEIVESADRESTAQNLQLPNSNRFSNHIPAIERYLKIIRHWIQDGVIKINTNGGMGWVDEYGHLYLVCRSLAEKLIQECNAQGLKNLPQDPVRVYDILQEHGYALSLEDGKAIWPIRVKTSQYEHKFTCLKFESRRLTLPARPLRPLEGEISLAGQEIEESPQSVRETESVKETETPQEQEENNNQVAEKSAGETVAISDASMVLELESAGDTAEKNKEAEKLVDESDSNTLESKSSTFHETGATSENVGFVRNLEFESSDTAPKFLSWLQRGLVEKTILVNNNAAEVHIVEEGVFLLAPAIFKTFLRLHNLPEEKHKNLSKRFGRLRKHIRNGDVNIHPYWVSSSNRASKINGWLLPFNIIYEHGYPIPKPNKYIKKYLGENNDA